MMSEIMEVPFPLAASRRLINFLTFHISICKYVCQHGLVEPAVLLVHYAGRSISVLMGERSLRVLVMRVTVEGGGAGNFQFGE